MWSISQNKSVSFDQTSVLGGIIIAIGLYSVVWGKRKDYTSPEELSTTAAKGNQELPIATTNIATT
jgi:hypothetical protein